MDLPAALLLTDNVIVEHVSEGQDGLDLVWRAVVNRTW